MNNTVLSKSVLCNNGMSVKLFGPWGRAERLYDNIMTSRTMPQFIDEWSYMNSDEMILVEEIVKCMSSACDWLPNYLLFPNDDIQAITLEGSSEMYEVTLPLQIKNDLGVDISQSPSVMTGTVKDLVAVVLQSRRLGSIE